MNSWAAAEILLAAAVLALAMPREDGFLLPEPRDWLWWLRRFLPKARREREEAAGVEADKYVLDLRTDKDQDPMIIRADQLPSRHRAFKTPLLTKPTPEQATQKQPWKTAANPAWDAPGEPQPPERPRRRAPGDPPTIVIELMRPAIGEDLGRYLAELPAYTDEASGDALFVPRSSLALGTPDHHGAPGDDHEPDREEGDLHPDQPGAVDLPVEDEDVGEGRPAEG